MWIFLENFVEPFPSRRNLKNILFLWIKEEYTVETEQEHWHNIWKMVVLVVNYYLYTISRIKGIFPILLILTLFYQLFFNYLNMLVLMWCIDACLVIEIAFYCSIFLYLSFYSHINAVCIYCNLINKRVSRWHEVFRYLNFPHIWLHSNIFLKR